MQLLKYLLIGTAAVTEARQEPRSISCTFVRNDQRGNFITQCGTQDYFAGKGGDDALGAICTRTLDVQGKAITTCDSPEIICQETQEPGKPPALECGTIGYFNHPALTTTCRHDNTKIYCLTEQAEPAKHRVMQAQ